MKKNRGFTLLELIGVMIVLAIISMLVIPQIIAVLRNSKEDLYKEQVNLILDAAKNYGVDHYDELDEINITFLTLDKLISSGYIETEKAVDPRTDSEMKGCVMVSYEFNSKKYNYEYLEDCDRNKYANKLELSDNYSGDWQAEVTVHVETGYLGTDESTTYRYCVSTTKCNPNIGVDAASGDVSVDTESENSYVCAVSVTSSGAESEVQCVGPFKVDKTAPVLTIPGDEELDSLITTYDVMKGVSAVDNVTPSNQIQITVSGSVSLGKLGPYVLTYTAKDKAGNVAIKKRTVTIVDITNPEINVAISGNPYNDYGWATNGVDVYVSATDLGGSGVAGYRYCISDAKCTPNTWVGGKSTDTIHVTKEGTTGTVCVQAQDGAGNTSDVKCTSSNMKIDMTDPSCELNVAGDTVNGWYIGNAVVTFKSKSDDVTSYNITNNSSPSYGSTSSYTVNYDTEGTTIYGYVRDKAGRVGKCTTVVYRDTSSPTCGLKIDTSESANGWRNQSTSVSFDWKSNDVTSYNVTTNSWASYDGNSSTTVNWETSGQSVYGYVKDRAGHTGSCSTSVKINWSGPSAPSVSTDGKTGYLSGGSDDQGICWYQVDGTRQTSGTFTNLTYGNHTAYAVDCAGNVGTGQPFTIQPKVTTKTGQSSCVWQCNDPNGKNCGQGGTNCNSKKVISMNTINATAQYTSATSISAHFWGKFNTGSAWLGIGSYRYMCLSNHHGTDTGEGYCKSSSQQIKSRNDVWDTRSNVSFDVTLTLNNPSGCYDLMIFASGQTGAHITATIPNVVCTG